MICRYCGNTVDAEATVCPYCGSALVGYNAPINFEEESQQFDEEMSFEEQEEYVRPKRKGIKLPALPFSTILSLACALFSFLCLLTVSSIKGSIKESTDTLSSGIAQLQSASVTIQERLDSMEGTVADVQNNAYNQLASANITITKDITSLTGPVTLGKYNQMFIVRAKGNLNLNTSFDWQKYNQATGGWVSIVFTGNATSNEEYGLRLENKMEEGEYVSVLWANGITEAGAGTYRCVISDSTGVKKTSSEAIVQVTA